MKLHHIKNPRHFDRAQGQIAALYYVGTEPTSPHDPVIPVIGKLHTLSTAAIQAGLKLFKK